MNYAEEQRNELEALSEIYYSEISVIKNESPISFSIKIRHQASNYERPESAIDGDRVESDDESEASESENVSDDPWVELKFELPSKYPDEKPSIEVLESQNLDEDDLEELLTNLNSKADESLGNVMIFTLVSDIVEWLIMISEREANAIDEEKQRKLREDEQEERRKQEGTHVTEATFLAWKAKFDAEMLKARLENQRRQAEGTGSSSKRLTGREMFESDKTLAESDLNFVEDLEQDQLEALLQNIDDIDLEDQDLEAFIDDEDSSDDEVSEFDEGSDSEEEGSASGNKAEKFGKGCVSKR